MSLLKWLTEIFENYYKIDSSVNLDLSLLLIYLEKNYDNNWFLFLNIKTANVIGLMIE